MNAASQRDEAVYLVDNHHNLHIQAGDQRLLLTPAGALELLRFLERCQFQQNANTTRGATQ